MAMHLHALNLKLGKLAVISQAMLLEAGVTDEELASCCWGSQLYGSQPDCSLPGTPVTYTSSSIAWLIRACFALLDSLVEASKPHQ